MPTSHPRHSITETPALAAVLDLLRRRLGADVPTVTQLVALGAEVTVHEIEVKERALATFVDRLSAGPAPDLEEIEAIRHASRAS